MSDKEFEPLKPQPRQLSKFLAEEMLYDAISKNLDPSREGALQDFLKSSPETLEIKNQMSAALEYCHLLSETKVSEPFLTRLTSMKSIYQRVVDKLAWSKWPDTLRWTIEALVVAGLAGVVVIFLWPYVSQYAPTRSQEVVLVEVDKPSTLSEEVSKEEAASIQEPTPAISISANTQLKEPEVKAELVQQPQMESVSSPQKIVETAPPPPAPSTRPAAPEPAPISSPVTTPRETNKKSARKGELYRALMTLDNIDIVTDQITDVLVELGAEKAGDVKLGWRKPSGSYYHFSLPESNYDQVMTKLQTFGPVRISKEPHWRVMPEGKIRFILEVKDAAATEAKQE